MQTSKQQMLVSRLENVLFVFFQISSILHSLVVRLHFICLLYPVCKYARSERNHDMQIFSDGLECWLALR